MPNCNPGNKACGGRCIPQEKDCAKALGKRGGKNALQAAGLAGAALGASIGGKVLEGVGTAKATAHLVSHLTMGDKNLQHYEKVNARIQRRYGNTQKATKLSNAMLRRAGGIKGTKSIQAGGLLKKAAIPVGVLAGVKAIQSAQNYRAAMKEKKSNRADSIWATGFEHESSEYLPRHDAIQCGPKSKNCGEGCIPKNYNCEMALEVDRTGRGYKRNRTLAMGAGFAGLGAGAIGAALHNSAPLSKPAQYAAAGLAAAGGAGALGFGIAARHNQKRHANAVLAASEDERNSEKRSTMQTLGQLWGGTPEGAAEVRSRYKKRKDSTWAYGF